MRRPEYFLGGLEQGGDLDESDFRRGLELVSEPDAISKVQQYDALQAFVHWGLAGERPDLALEAYDAYVLHGWSWQTQVNNDGLIELQNKTDEYFNARYAKEEETGQEHDGMAYFSLTDVDHYGAIQIRADNREDEGEAFRNDVLPRILTGMNAGGHVQKSYDFLTSRRAIHDFKGHPRELEFAQCVDVHVDTALALLKPENAGDFDGDPVAAFKDLAGFSLEHAKLPQFGEYQLLPRLTPIRDAMIEHGLADPWKVLAGELDWAAERFEDMPDFLFNGIRRYLAAVKAGDIADLRPDIEWPRQVLDAFELTDRNPSMPSGLAWLIPAVRDRNTPARDSDMFQSQPTAGAKILRAAFGDEAAKDEVIGQMNAANQLDEAPPTLEAVLRRATRAF